MTEQSIAADWQKNWALQLALINACLERAGQCDVQDILPNVEEGLQRVHALDIRCFEQPLAVLSDAVMKLFECGRRLTELGQREQGFELLQSGVVVAGRWLDLSSVGDDICNMLRFLTFYFDPDELDNAPEIRNACAALILTYGGSHFGQTLIEALPSNAPRGKLMLLHAEFLLRRHRTQEASWDWSTVSGYLGCFDVFLSNLPSLGSNSLGQHYRRLCISEFEYVAQHIPVPSTEEQACHLYAIPWLFEKGMKLDQGLEVALLLKRHLLAGLSFGFGSQPRQTADALRVILSVIQWLRDAGHEVRDIVSWSEIGIDAAISFANPEKFWLSWIGNRNGAGGVGARDPIFECMQIGALLVYERLDLDQDAPISSFMLDKILAAAGSFLGSCYNESRTIEISHIENSHIDPICRDQHIDAHIIWLATLKRLRRRDMVGLATYSTGKDAVIDQVALHGLPLRVLGSERILPAYRKIGWNPDGGQVFGDILSRTAELACTDGQDGAAPDDLFLSCLMLGSTGQPRSGPDFPASRLRRCLDLWRNSVKKDRA